MEAIIGKRFEGVFFHNSPLKLKKIHQICLDNAKTVCCVFSNKTVRYSGFLTQNDRRNIIFNQNQLIEEKIIYECTRLELRQFLAQISDHSNRSANNRKKRDKQLAKGLIERIGSQALVTLQATGKSPVKHAAPLRDHKAALDHIIKWIISEEAQIPGIQSLNDIHAVGHRVVHGAERFTNSTLIDDNVIHGIEDCIDLAPLHNPANLKGITASREVFGTGIPQAVVFDTSFHSTMPETSFLYAIPYQLYRRHKIRRYGFHGTSHRYVAYRYRQLTGKSREETNIITVHLGNGCSACAIKSGASFDTSMGLSPLEGLVMGTRCGDIDPAVLEFLSHKEGMSMNEIDALLNKQSGLLGISGLTNDMRDLLEEAREHQDRRATLAINMFAQRVKKYIGSYLAEMNGADAIVFTGGIGENSVIVRQRICANLEWLGIEIDEQLNSEKVGGMEGEINKKDSRMKVFVIPTNEELLIARDTVRCVLSAPQPKVTRQNFTLHEEPLVLRTALFIDSLNFRTNCIFRTHIHLNITENIVCFIDILPSSVYFIH